MVSANRIFVIEPPTRTHYLKIAPHWFERVKAGEKRAEIRKHDRDYQVGDTLVLVSAPDSMKHWAAEELLKREHGDPVESINVHVLHVLPAHLTVGIAEGYALLSVEVVK